MKSQTIRGRIFACLLSVVGLMSAGFAAADSADPVVAPEVKPLTAHETVSQVADNLIKAIENHRDTMESEPESFFVAVGDVLDPVVDFSWIAQNVMAGYYKAANDEQRQRFAKVFRDTLVTTYAKGMMSYTNQEFVVIPPKNPDSSARRVSVEQEVRGEKGIFPVYYTMALDKEGHWKLLNVTLDGVNLGRTFRSQFEASAREFDGDVDKVIEAWQNSVEPLAKAS